MNKRLYNSHLEFKNTSYSSLSNGAFYILAGRFNPDRQYINVLLRSSLPSLLRLRLNPQTDRVNIFYGYIGRPASFIISNNNLSNNIFFVDYPPLPSILKYSFFRILNSKLNHLFFEKPNDKLIKYKSLIFDHLNTRLSSQELELDIIKSSDSSFTNFSALYIKESPVLDILLKGRLSTMALELLIKNDISNLAVSSKKRVVEIDPHSLVCKYREVDVYRQTVDLRSLNFVVCPSSLLGIELWLRGLTVFAYESSYLGSLQYFHSQRTDKQSMSSRIKSLFDFLLFTLFTF
jgi:hypothetical protein